MDAGDEAGEDGDMSGVDHELEAMSDEGRRLWATALDLARSRLPVTRRALPPLLFITDPVRTPEPWITAARLPSGSGVIYRHFGAAGAVETARRLRAATGRRNVRLLIGNDEEMAAAIGADGVHLPQARLDEAGAVRRRLPDGLLTAAFHAGAMVGDEAIRALDAVVVSPVFTAGGQSPKRPELDPEGLAAVAATLPLPVYALGGISTENASRLIGTGACGIAAVDGIVSAFGD